MMNNKIPVVFVTDGGPDIGMGHVTRCLSLAESLLENSFDVSFICVQPTAYATITKSGFNCRKVPGLNHVEKVKNILDKQSVSILIADSYQISKQWFEEAVTPDILTVYFDDNRDQDWDEDVLINGNIHALELSYPKKDFQLQLLGTSFISMRKQFQNLPRKKISQEVRHILITTGGSDSLHLTPVIMKTVEQMEQFRSATIHVVIGPAFGDLTEIQYLAANHPSFVLHRNVADMAGLMLKADLAISGAGSTLYELCACGTPAVSIIIANNQVLAAETFHNSKLILCAGYADGLNGLEVSGLEDKLGKLACVDERKAQSIQMQEVVDGMGCERIAKALKTHLVNRIN